MCKTPYKVFLFIFFFALSQRANYCSSQTQSAPGGTVLRKHHNDAFKRGEVLKYRAHYGWISAGEAELTVKNETKKIGNRNAYHIVGVGYTTGAFGWFFKVRDRYETYIDEEAIIPWIFVRRVSEGGYTLSRDIVFNPFENTATSSDKGAFNVPPYVQDILSTFYYARCLNYTGMSPGDEMQIDIFFDNEIYPMKIRYYGKEVIAIKENSFRCLKFKPMVQKGRVFEEQGDLTFWISDDNNHIPILLQADVLVGSLKMELKEYSGTIHPMAIVRE